MNGAPAGDGPTVLDVGSHGSSSSISDPEMKKKELVHGCQFPIQLLPVNPPSHALVRGACAGDSDSDSSGVRRSR